MTVHTLKLDNTLCGKNQLRQHKGVCYSQVATYPIDLEACLGEANVLRKQELRL